ncbi:MAG: hypothetical protein AAB871_03515 [Patescibacteria group bacterium]
MAYATEHEEWQKKAYCAFCLTPIDRQKAESEQKCPECGSSLVNPSDIPHILPAKPKTRVWPA